MSSTATDNLTTDANATGSAWTMPWSDSFTERETQVWKNNLPLVISTSLSTAIYSYSMIDKSTNNAINRGLLMALSTFLGVSLVDLLEVNNLVDTSGNAPMIAEVVAVPLIYYYINRQQFQLPDLQSQAIKTAAISAIAGQLVAPYLQSYMDGRKK
jgi:hypothetical protein